MNPVRPIRVLFVSEHVTLAQVVRLVALARSLDPRRYEVHFASASFDPIVFHDVAFRTWPIHSLSKERVERAVSSGRRIYDLGTLAAYLADDLRVLDAVAPDVVVGDLRWSLAVSAPLRGVPYAALANAYWSPYAERDGFPMPDHPIVRLLGVDLASRYFPRALPKVMDHFAAPLNALRRRHGLSEIGSLPEVLTFGDGTLYADTPALVPTRALPDTHHWLGPVLWAPDVPMPAAWLTMPVDRPRVYVTLGSSGRVDRLPVVLEALAPLDVSVLVATAGRARIRDVPKNAVLAEFVPGDVASRGAALVVCNGGSSTGYQALAEGAPVLGIASNLDQYLAMDAIARTGAGLLVRAGTATVDEVRRAAVRLLGDDAARRAAARIRDDFAQWRPAERLDSILSSLAGRARARSG